MRLSHRRFVRTDIWREGTYLDLWSVPHVLSGMMVALGLYLLNFRTVSAFTIAFLIFVMYEMFEALVKIEETRINRILDVVVGMASFAPAFLFAPYFTYTELIFAFAGITITDGVLSFFGWLESQKALVLEQKLRAEYEFQKAKMRGRREKLQARFRKNRYRIKEAAQKLEAGIERAESNF